MTSGDSDDLVGEVVERTLWAFPGVDLGARPGVGQRSVAERVLVGWAAPSDALAREAVPGPVDASRLAGFGGMSLDTVQGMLDEVNATRA